MNFFCTACDKKFTTKQNFERHLKTKKHLKIQYGHPMVTPRSPQGDPIFPLDEHICSDCNSKFKTRKGLLKHNKYCLKKKLIEKDKENKLLLKKIRELKDENKELKQNIQEKIKESNQDIKDITKLALITQKGHMNINSSYNIIINNYKNAPNLTLPKDLIINESLDKYIESGNPQGIVNFLDKYYGSQIPPEYRSLWCIDATRCKFVLRHNNEWIIDLDANKFRELTFYSLQDMFYQKQKKLLKYGDNISFNNLDNNKLLSNVKFLGGFVDKKEQIKIIRNLSKKVYFNKDIDFNEPNKKNIIEI